MISKFLALRLAVVLAAAVGTSTTASAFDYWGRQEMRSQNFAHGRQWHGGYYYQPYAQPTALVVPPNVTHETVYSWGVSQNLMVPLHHQFGRNMNSPGAASPGMFRPTPYWPSHTDQFGVYYVRGPWR
jgi:hypothetical protein